MYFTSLSNRCIQSVLRLDKQCLYRVYNLVYMVQRVANSSGFRPRPAMHDITLKSKGLEYDKETKIKSTFLNQGS